MPDNDASDIGDISEKLGRPRVDTDAWVAPGVVVLGDVRIARGASVWYGCVLRSDIDLAPIEIGEDSNVQDGSVVHVDFGMPCVIGARVTIGHGATVHGVTIGDDCLIGMGAVLLSGAKIGAGSIVAAGAVVPEGKEFPPGSLIVGVPAKSRRDLTDADRARIDKSWRDYSREMALHRRSDPGAPHDGV
ncbi:MAG: gamma carbonic anhydrase family protein [Planctomycetota bacterium]|jgi:carbonic anhydrase/acetyltransferase-like protein (isoleucine patch superfamily)